MGTSGAKSRKFRDYLECQFYQRLQRVIGGGEGGIRTLDTLASMPHFECGAFNRSATSPEAYGARSRAP
jgi:hypothetical protein